MLHLLQIVTLTCPAVTLAWDYDPHYTLAALSAFAPPCRTTTTSACAL
jgi:hypothetical protein